MLVRLNVETASFHAEADAPWRVLTDPARELTRLDYVHHLIQRYAFDGPLEAALAYTPQLEALLSLQQRFRAGRIAQDLLSLGASPAELANLRQCMIAPFSSPSEAMGWLYVHQRCTLLFDAARTELLRKLPELSFATCYLRTVDGRVGVAWDDVGQVLDTVAQTTMFSERVVAAARDAFQTMIEWNQRSGADARLQGMG